MTHNVDIWKYPARGQRPDLSWAGQAADVGALRAAASVKEQHALSVIKAGMGVDDAALRRIAGDMKTLGIGFNVDQLLGAFAAQRPKAETLPQDLLFALSIPLAPTRARQNTPPFDNVIRSDVTRRRRAIATQISAHRSMPLHAILPDGVVERNPRRINEWLSIDTHYWSPDAERPALALVETQNDRNMPVGFFLSVHGAAAHRNVMSITEQLGGRLA